MPARTIQRILDDHGVSFRIVGGRIIADHMLSLPEGVEMPWVDVTDWSRAKMGGWLGYDAHGWAEYWG